MAKYIIEKKIESEERFYGDHFPAFLEKKENAGHFPKKAAKAIAEELGSEWEAIKADTAKNKNHG